TNVDRLRIDDGDLFGQARFVAAVGRHAQERVIDEALEREVRLGTLRHGRVEVEDARRRWGHLGDAQHTGGTDRGPYPGGRRGARRGGGAEDEQHGEPDDRGRARLLRSTGRHDADL